MRLPQHSAAGLVLFNFRQSFLITRHSLLVPATGTFHPIHQATVWQEQFVLFDQSLAHFRDGPSSMGILEDETAAVKLGEKVGANSAALQDGLQRGCQG